MQVTSRGEQLVANIGASQGIHCAQVRQHGTVAPLQQVHGDAGAQLGVDGHIAHIDAGCRQVSQ